MLRNLIIKNYALIEKLDLEFGPGLTIITGETGAGKSIMLGALSLVMGGRADTKVIADANSKSVVEALFVDVDSELKQIFDEKGIDWIVNDEGITELTVRRELSASGRSKVFVNDTSVTLQTLQLIVARLIDIHSQHANAKINDVAERLKIIDAIACNDEIREVYQTLFSQYVELRRRIKSLRESIEQASENLEFLKFQLSQLDKLQPKKGELKEIEARFEILSDADEIKEKMHQLLNLLGDGDNGVQSLLQQSDAIASKIDFSLFEKPKDASSSLESDSSSSTGSISERLKLLIVEIKDIFETIDDYNSSIDTDPALLARLSERMNLYYETVRRFGVDDADKLVDLHEEIRNKISAAGGDDTLLPELEKKARRLAAELREKADELSSTRRRTADDLAHSLCEKAKPLGLPNIRFECAVNSTKLKANGQDEIEFLCSFNKNGTPRPLNEIASGGEISRMMLSLKSILAGHINLPTIIFDEVDTGVSGEIADKMGEMMREVAADMQVIVITHLPQVAAKGDRHFKVFKTDVENKTVTQVRQLDDDGRVAELASMISGSSVSDAAVSAAKALLSGVKENKN